MNKILVIVAVAAFAILATMAVISQMNPAEGPVDVTEGGVAPADQQFLEGLTEEALTGEEEIADAVDAAAQQAGAVVDETWTQAQNAAAQVTQQVQETAAAVQQQAQTAQQQVEAAAEALTTPAQ